MGRGKNKKPTLYVRLLADYESLGTRTPEGCLLWNYGCSGKVHANNFIGYGYLPVNGIGRPLIRVMAHHFIDPEFPIVYDPATKLVVDHTCLVTNCYEPSHLQIVTQRENLTLGTNSDLNPNRTSQYRGVSWNKERKLWTAHFYHNGKKLHLGGFASEEDAAIAYQKKLAEITAPKVVRKLNPRPLKRR